MTRARGLSQGQVRRTPTQPRSADTVAVILAGAERVLLAEGMPGLTVRAVARAAGVSPGSVYQYFDGVDAIAERLIDACTDRVTAAAEAAITDVVARGDRDGLAAVTRATFRAHRADLPLRRALIQQSHTRVTARWRAAEQETVARTVALLTASDAGRDLTPAQARAAAAVLVGAVEGAIDLVFADPDADLDHAEALLVRMVQVAGGA